MLELTPAAVVLIEVAATLPLELVVPWTVTVSPGRSSAGVVSALRVMVVALLSETFTSAPVELRM